MISVKTNISISNYIDTLVDMYYPYFDPFFSKVSRTNIKLIIKHNIFDNYLYDHTNLVNNDIRKKYIFIAVIKFLAITDYEHIDYEIHTLRGEIQTLLFREQAKRLAEEFINTENEESIFKQYKTAIKKDVVMNYLSKSL